MPTEPLQVLPKDAEGDFITAQEKSDVVHDLLAFPCRADVGDEQADAAGYQRLLGLAGNGDRGQGRGSVAQYEGSGIPLMAAVR
jgi:hypothetical protein